MTIRDIEPRNVELVPGAMPVSDQYETVWYHTVLYRDAYHTPWNWKKSTPPLYPEPAWTEQNASIWYYTGLVQAFLDGSSFRTVAKSYQFLAGMVRYV